MPIKDDVGVPEETAKNTNCDHRNLDRGKNPITAHRTSDNSSSLLVEARTRKVSTLLSRQESRDPQSEPAGRERDLLGKADDLCKARTAAALEGS
ncbi:MULTISPECIES: hypothetical protein [Bradyrhizobium]|uniref:Uncharacterized protein n=3 Tax=Bradyrhizobium TaxID=374 RepID=A0ACD3VNF7_9BRAD|nr:MULTISPECIES: hypothetical protein [Bradyrhizobium]UFX49442.1 hypothetical protein HAP47_0040940 [Bradyrhizobium sp. 41S5]UGA49079.1 hypothetical protein HU230_0043525 [Bradyrhizobium quebecense]UGY07407.1 hypothetical protein J4P68_0040220 [Bradyrhizobium quebecense]UGY11771.1 hypothetical protein HAP48_0001230 [Bradyrhizobium septentrionale]UGY29984.1 hypothetical protein HU675_0048625 [Bradyrhizobium septentrionale]